MSVNLISPAAYNLLKAAYRCVIHLCRLYLLLDMESLLSISLLTVFNYLDRFIMWMNHQVDFWFYGLTAGGGKLVHYKLIKQIKNKLIFVDKREEDREAGS